MCVYTNIDGVLDEGKIVIQVYEESNGVCVWEEGGCQNGGSVKWREMCQDGGRFVRKGVVS